MIGRRILAVLGLCLGLVQAANAEPSGHRETGFLDRSVLVHGVEYRYEVYVPRTFDPKRRWPVILALHGGGDYGADGLRVTVGTLADNIRLYGIVARALKGMPIWIVHGDADKNVSVEESRRMAAALTAIGADVHYTEVPGADHRGAWVRAYNDPEIATWLLAQRSR